jgi:hypothetical protein
METIGISHRIVHFMYTPGMSYGFTV